MKETTCCFTGHRNIPAIIAEPLRDITERKIKSLIDIGIDTFICGGAVGFDMICGLTVSRIKEENNNIKLILFLPHYDQDRFYNQQNKTCYNHLKKVANEIIYTSRNYYNGCLHLRNRLMVENSSYLISYCTKNYGGSYYTREYANLCGLNIINVTDGSLF